MRCSHRWAARLGDDAMEEISAKSFEQVLTSTVRMIRSSWNVPVCIFIQADDKGLLRIRACDGLKMPVTRSFKPGSGLVARCLEKNEVLESGDFPWDEGMQEVLRPAETKGARKFVAVPVAGQSRTLGVLILGPVAQETDFKSRE